MAFKYDSTPVHQFKRWLADKEEFLLNSGLPLAIFENHRNWNKFLDDGEWGTTVADFFDVRELDSEKSLALRNFLIENDVYKNCTTLIRLNVKIDGIHNFEC